MKSSEYQPTFNETVARLQSVLQGAASREDVSKWAERWVMSDEADVSDSKVWRLLKLIAGIDSKVTPKEYLYLETDVQSWLKAATPTVTLQDLIGKGYFPKELIPSFTTVSFSKALPSLIQDVDFSQGLRKTSKVCPHSIPKHKHQRRRLGIPNPLHQMNFCRVISNNWHQIAEYTEKSSLSLSTPVSGKKKAVECKFDYFDGFHRERILRSVGHRYCLRTDLSRYYSTIYTHSIPWALHDKAIAKTKKWDKSLLGNLLDEGVRNAQDGQTIGIPVGPDSSLVLAEIIATSIDHKLAEEFGKPLSGCRYVDDYYLYFKTASDAELAMCQLQGVLNEFELETNSRKTYIKELPEVIEEEWVSELRRYQISDEVRSQKNDVIDYFSRAFRYSSLYPDSYVIKYALSKLTRNRSINISEKNWSIFESFVLQSVVADPSSLSQATTILLNYMYRGYSLNKSRIKEAILEIATHSTQLLNSNEIIWCLWLFKVLKITLDDNLVRALCNVEDALVALATLDLRDSGLTKSNFDVSSWENLMTNDDLYSRHWLLAYEASVKGWLKAPNQGDYISQDPFFSVLRANNVSFYDTRLPLNLADIDYSNKPMDLPDKSESQKMIKPNGKSSKDEENSTEAELQDVDSRAVLSYFY